MGQYSSLYEGAAASTLGVVDIGDGVQMECRAEYK